MTMDYSKWDQVVDSDDESSKKQTPAAAAAAVRQKKLLELQKEDPAKLDQLEAEIKAMRLEAERAKEEPGKVQSVKKSIKPLQATLNGELADLEAQRSALRDQEAQLSQLASCGDERGILEFFAKQGMTPEDLQRAMGGGSMEKTLAEVAERTAKPADPNVERSLKIAEQLKAAVLTGEAPEEEEEEVYEVLPLAPPAPLIIVQPSCSQRQPTADDNSLVVSISLPELNSAAEASLDISERLIRLRAPILSKEGPPREYLLTVALSRRVVAAKAVAKWKSKRHELQITIPIDNIAPK